MKSRHPSRRGFARAAVAVAVTATILGAGGAAYAQPTTGASSQAFAAGRILVMPRAGLPDAAMDKILKENGGGKSRRIGKSELRIIDLPSGSEKAMVAKLLRHPHIKFAELDEKVEPAFAANDSYIGSQWHLPVIGATQAWDVSQGTGVTIAVLDSGVLASHPDLLLVAGRNTHANNSDTSDVTGHGTAVAGAAAAAMNNSIGVAGVAGRSKIMPIRITDSAGTAYYSTIATGVTYAADNGARVANCSYGYLFKTASVQSAGSYLKSKGGLLVVSAGNYGVNENASATSSMITVSATDTNDAMASWSSYGSMVSVAAPGVGIWTTSNDGTYRSASGTSFSAPVTAGVIALMMAANPTLSSTQIEQLLFSTATDLGASGKDIYYGYGRVDANAAVLAAKGAASADTQAPSVSIVSPGASATVSGLVAVDVGASDNVGVTRVELRVNGNTVATDVGPTFSFSWDSGAAANGSQSLTAVAYDAAGNSKVSSPVTVNVANNVVADTTPPLVSITNPANGSKVSGTVTIGLAASDNSGSTGLRGSLYIDGKLVVSTTGGSLSYKWNTRKASTGVHTIEAVAQDASGNRSSVSVQVSK